MQNFDERDIEKAAKRTEERKKMIVREWIERMLEEALETADKRIDCLKCGRTRAMQNISRLPKQEVWQCMWHDCSYKFPIGFVPSLKAIEIYQQMRQIDEFLKSE